MSQWKKGIPTTPGYYWAYWQHDEEPFILKVDEGGTIYCFGREEPLDYTTGRITLHDIDELYWLGPIEIPAGPAGD